MPRSSSAALACGATVWLTGCPSSGKSAIARALEAELRRFGHDPMLFDGDELRQTVSRDLGFSRKDRAEAVRRAGALGLAVARTGRLAIVSLVSPYIADRRRVRDEHERAKVRFVEVYVSCPPAVAESRDLKGLYRRARAGVLQGLTGFDAPYEPPPDPELVLDTELLSVAREVDLLLGVLGLRPAGDPGPP